MERKNLRKTGQILRDAIELITEVFPDIEIIGIEYDKSKDC